MMTETDIDIHWLLLVSSASIHETFLEAAVL